uniref:LIM domain-containing protein n=1 Tax=Macrostomum lignano TaxID=282301 RepID=A0A1I8HVY0_9PLAT
MAGNRHSPPHLQKLDSSNKSILLQRRMAAFGTAELDSNEGDCLVQLTEDRPLSTVSVALSGSSINTNRRRQLEMLPAACSHCGESFDVSDKVLKAGGSEAWHEWCLNSTGECFCEHDFHVLFKPCCAKCGDYIVGPVVRALQASWHPTCFACHRCGRVLADAFVKSLGRALCRECNLEERMQSTVRYLCNRCKDFVDEAELLRYRGDNYHAYHFACTTCRIELTAEAREKDDRLYCIRCFDKLGIPVCARCRRPIDQERVVRALGRAWHVEHFVCAACEKPFNGTRYFERRGLAYCETHFHQLFGQLCFLCGDSISKECVQTCGKSWCRAHFRCTVCDREMDQKSKFYEYDLKPVCKRCYQKFPTELRKRLAKIHKQIR